MISANYISLAIKQNPTKTAKADFTRLRKPKHPLWFSQTLICFAAKSL